MITSDMIKTFGHVYPYFINLKSGEKISWSDRHNTISYEASFSMASAFGGDSTYIPNKIGIIYGSSSDPQFPQTISREQSWEELKAELNSKNADIQVQAFSSTPSLKKIFKSLQPDSSGSGSSASESSQGSESSEVVLVPGTSVTFHAHTDSVTPGAFRTYNDEATSAQGHIFTTNTYIYQAVLLNNVGEKYRVLARASLIDGLEYHTKPANFEVAIDWAIKFF